MKNGETHSKKIDYKWVIIGICFLMVFICLGFCSSTKSLYVAPVTEYLGIKRSTYSLNDSFRYIATSIVNLFFGILVAKFGTKKLILAGFTSLILANIVYAFASNVIVFYLGGTLLGIGLCWTTTTMVGCVVNRWCSENKGTIMGAVLAANGLGGALAMQIVTPIIYQDGNPTGYKSAYLLTAAILLVVAVVVAILYRERSVTDHINEGGSHKHKKSRGQSWKGIEYSEIIKKPVFYFALVCIFFTGFILQGITGIAAAHLKDVGIDAGYIALIMSAHSLALAGFKFLTGIIYDRFGLRITSNICSVTAVIVMFALAMVTNSFTGKILAMIYGIFSSLALPLETIMLPIYASDLFGDKAFNKVLGLFASVNTAGYALGAPLVNLCYDILGSYRVALVICGFMMLAVVITLQFVMSTARHEKEEILNA